MKNKKVLLCLIPLLMTACAEPIIVPADDILMPTAIAETADTIPAAGNITTEDSVDEETVPTRAIGTDMCDIHILEYHSYPGELIDYIGEKFYDWVYTVESQPDSDLTDDCPYSHCNIIECLKYFDISEEEFTELYYTSLYYYKMYDPELMYSENTTEIQNFFLDDMTGEENLEFEKRGKIRSAKVYLRTALSEMAVDEQIVEKYQELPLTAWTFPDIIREAQISQSTFEAFLSEHRSFSDAFDVEAIYTQIEVMEEVTLAEMNTTSKEETLLEKCLDNIEYEMQFFVGE